MYSGIIIEIRNDYAIVKSKENGYIKIRKKSEMRIGKSIYYFDEDIYKKANSYKKYTVAAAVLLFIIIIGLYVNTYDIHNPMINNRPNLHEDYSFAVLLSIDINPSLELELDENLNVKDVRYLNDEAEELVNKELLINKYYTIALKDVLTQAREDGYIHDDGAVMISAVNTNDNTLNIEEQISEVFKEEQEVKLIIIDSDKKLIKSSREKNVSIGKYTLYDNLKQEEETKTSVQIDDIKTMKIVDMVNNGILNSNNSKIMEETSNSNETNNDISHETTNDISNENIFIVNGGIEYINPSILQKMGFEIEFSPDYQEVSITRNNRTFKLDSKYSIFEYENSKYVLLKETFDFFKVKYDYRGYNMTVIDDNNKIELIYGNPAGKTISNIEKKPMVTDKVSSTIISEKIKKDDSPKMEIDKIIMPQIPTIPETKVQPNEEMIVFGGSEFIIETLLTNNQFSILKQEDYSFLITYKANKAVIGEKSTKIINGIRYYPLKEIMDLFGIKYEYRDSYFYIHFEGKEIELKYRNIE